MSVHDLSKQDLQIFVEEVVSRLREGETRNQVASDLNWSNADFNDLLQHKVFEEHYAKVDAVGFDAFKQTEFDVVIGSARQFARDRMSVYIEQLDELARKSSNENVRYNAVMSLLRLAGASENEQAEEVVQLPKSHVEQFRRAFRDVATEERKIPLKV